ncbi:hypothetical protein BDR22DRAFT_887234 [Usnea florida]
MSKMGLMTTSKDASEACPSSDTFCTYSRAWIPPELWAIIINTMRDRKSQAELAYLWITDCPYDRGQLSFEFGTLDIADRNRAIFKFQASCWKTPPPSLLEGLSLILSNEDHESALSNSGKEDEASTVVSDPESDLFNSDLPTFVVQVRGGLIDSEVPTVRLDIGNREISVDWRKVYTSYFSQCLAGIAQKETDMALTETSPEADARTKHFQHLHHLKHVHKDPEVNLAWNARLKEPSLQRWMKTLQVRAYRETCGYKSKNGSVLTAEKSRQRRIADFEVYLDDDGYVMPGNTSYEAIRQNATRSASA